MSNWQSVALENIADELKNIREILEKQSTTEQSSKVEKWIKTSERLPESDGDYLAWAKFDHEDDYAPSVINYDACAEAFGVWDNYFDPDTLGFVGSDFTEINVIAWQPLPKSYTE